MKNEPALTIGAPMLLLAATLVLLQSFGVKLTGDQSAAILKFAEAALPLLLPAIGFLWMRSKVDGPVTASEKNAELSVKADTIVALQRALADK